jgi:predicted dehydrogenase
VVLPKIYNQFIMQSSRRKFIKGAGAASVLLATDTFAKPFNIIKDLKKISPNDKLRFATIGFGIQGHGDTRAALRNPDVEFVAAADLYDGRLLHAKEAFNKDLFTTRDYREILDRKDIDAVIVATPDHWHDHISIAAMKAGKNVYCQKPMVQHLDEGHALIDTWRKTGKTVQVGSQPSSGAAYAEARRLKSTGAIGDLNFIEATYDRYNALGAWTYSIPPDASVKTIDWDTFLGDAPKRPFDATRFFRWRNYRDYGTGVAGDLFVHLITGMHYATGAIGPERIFASGELSYWKDGRDVPDVMVTVLDYPDTEKHTKFQAVLRVNFANAGAIKNVTRIVGTEGEILWNAQGLTLTKRKLPKAPGYGAGESYATFSNDMQVEYKKEYDAKYAESDRVAPQVEEIKYETPKEDDPHAQHFKNFFDNVRKGSQETAQDPVFGFRAAAPALACNLSYFDKKIINWDPVAMKVKKK